MENQIAERLAQLKAEFEKGQRRLQELETESTNLKQTLLRISGAIQVLEELAPQQSENSQKPPQAQKE